MAESQIVLENVVKRFGNAVAVNTMNLEINAGEFLAIMGSSGCGKTTTLRMLAGLETPSEGEIRLNGCRINELKPHQRETPLVWQSLALFPFLSVLENVEFGLKMRNVSKVECNKRAMRWLERMQIAQFADRSVELLSGGQRQRVALARALVTEPPVLLLDEPLSALDTNLVVRMQSVLTQLQKELGITFIYVTHSQSEAFAMADRIVIMSEGFVEQVGASRDIYRTPANRFVAEFIGTNNIIAATVVARCAEQVDYKSDIGVLKSTPGKGVNQVGDKVDLVISADMIELASESSNADNEIAVKFVGEEFVGFVVTLYFEMANGDELKVQKQQREIEFLALHLGKRFYASWDIADVFCLPKARH